MTYRKAKHDIKMLVSSEWAASTVSGMVTLPLPSFHAAGAVNSAAAIEMRERIRSAGQRACMAGVAGGAPLSGVTPACAYAIPSALFLGAAIGAARWYGVKYALRNTASLVHRSCSGS